jgi:hypothetical protein
MSLTKVSYSMINGATVNVLDYGAVGDGSTDNTTAMTAAHATGKIVYYPAGDYRFNGTITISAGGIVGDSPSKTYLVSTSTTAGDLFTFTNSDQGYFSNFQIQAPTTKPSGAGIQILNASIDNAYSYFSNINFFQLPEGIRFTTARLFKVIACNFIDYRSAGCIVQNTINLDAGDSVISNCSFYGNSAAASYGVIQYSSGGLKIIGNKFNNGTCAYYLVYTVTSATSDLIIDGNSIEGMTGGAIVLTSSTGATYTFNNIVISNNQIAICANGITTDSSGFISYLSITGNVIAVSTSGYAVALVNVSNFTIGENSLRGSSATGIALDTCTNGKIGSNAYSIATPYTASSSTVSIQQDSQTGVSTTASSGWTGLGALYQSTATTVTFARAFLVAPALSDIQLTMQSGPGAVGAFISSVSTTNFVYYAVSTNNSSAAIVDWKAWGIL